MTKSNVHSCELKQNSFGLPKLPPNAPWYRKLFRCVRKMLTLNPNSTSSRRFFRNKSTMLTEQKRHLQGCPFVIHPFSTFNRVREMLFCLLWTMEMLMTPIFLSFIYITNNYYRHLEGANKSQSGLPSHEMYLYLIPIETILILTFFFTGYINIKSKEIIIEPTKIVKKYLCTYYFFDFAMCMKGGIYSMSTKHLYVMNLGCLFRANTVFTYLREIVLNLRMREEVYDCFRLLIVTAFMLNTWTCIFYYIPWLTSSWQSFPPNSWVVRAKINPATGIPIYAAYAECMLCIVCHFFGAGEGIHPIMGHDNIEKTVLVLVMMTGRMWTLYVIACILKIFSVVTISESKYEEYLLQLEVFMRQKRLPEALRNRLTEYYKYKYQNHFFNEQAIFATLSAYLRQELMLYGARKLIAKVELFRAFPRSVVGSIVASARQVVFLPNDVIVKAGETADDIYFISSGTVALLSVDGQEIVHLEDGDEIGLSGAFQASQFTYNFNYITVETTEMYIISRKDFRAHVFDQGDLLKYFSKKVQEKIDSFKNIEHNLKSHGYDLLSELSSGKILERPRMRATHFEP